jgi:hypothetical protein
MDQEERTGHTMESCFYLCPIGKSDSAVRKRSNQIYQHIVKATLEPLGYSVVRADHLEESGTITSHIIDGLLSSDLVVADLTDHNPNVFYELAIRHAVAKPFVQLIAEGQTLPFDIQGLRTVHLNHHDLDSVHEAKSAPSGMVTSIRTGKPVETPLTYTLNLQSLRQSDDSEARGIADIISEIEGLKQTIRAVAPEASPVDAHTVLNRDAIVMRSFIDYLAREGKVDAEDLRALKYRHGQIPKRMSKWVDELFRKYIPDEPPF